MAIVAENLFKNVKTTMKVMEVTPEMAASWLQRNSHNRDLSPARVNKYAESIIDGNWKMTYDPIRFDEKGVLLDGQHRLSAVVLAGLPITTLVVTGVESEVFDVLDSGAVRSGADILTIDGLSPRIAKATATAASLVSSYARIGTLNGAKLKKEHLRRFVSERPGLVRAAEYIQSLPRKNTPISDGYGTFLRYETARRDTDLSSYFFQALFTGANLEPDSMILYLRDVIHYDRRNNRISVGLQIKHVAQCVKVWNALRQGRKIKYKHNIRIRHDETFPVIK